MSNILCALCLQILISNLYSNLYGREWKVKHPKGTVTEFKAAWALIESDEEELTVCIVVTTCERL